MALAAGCTPSHHRAAAPDTPTTTIGAGAATASPSPTDLPLVQILPPVAGTFEPQSYTFVSTRVGWVLGTDLSIRHTVDGGTNWTKINSPKITGGLAQYVRGIRFANAQDGWVYGAGLWSTHDGGDHWHLVEPIPGVGFDIEAVEAASGRVHVVGLGEVPVIGSQTFGFAIASAAVGSDTFTLSPPVFSPGAGPAPYTSLVLHGTAGWVTTSNRGATGAARLVNGRWKESTLPCQGEPQLAAVSSSTVVAVCTEGAWTGPTTTYHGYISSDSGQTYKSFPSLLPSRTQDVAAPSPGTFVIDGGVSDPSELEMTTDGGRTWSSLYRLAGAFWTNLGFTTSQQGEAIAASHDGWSRLLMTTDGGHHWRTVNFGP
jgi:hypothetical protein